MFTETVRFWIIAFLADDDNRWSPSNAISVNANTGTTMRVLLDGCQSAFQSDTVLRAFWFGESSWIEDPEQHLASEDAGRLLVFADEDLARLVGIGFLTKQVRHAPGYEEWHKARSDEIGLPQPPAWQEEEGKPKTPVSRSHYNIGAIKDLLTAAFMDTSELRRVCRYRREFDPILGRVSEVAGMDEHIDMVIDYCESRLLWEELLAEVKRVNPRQYARFESRLRST